MNIDIIVFAVALLSLIPTFLIGTVIFAARYTREIRNKLEESQAAERRGLLTLDKEGQVNLSDWSRLATGRSGWIEIERAWLRKAQEVYNIFCEKQADYGPTNIAVGGVHGITVRLGDKISRLFELLGLTSRENTGEPANESIRDTMVDLGDYGIIGMIVLDGEWPLVDPDQVWGRDALVEIMMDMVGQDEVLYEALIIRLEEFRFARQLAEDIGGEVKSA